MSDIPPFNYVYIYILAMARQVLILIPSTQPLQTSIVRVAMNLNLFSILCDGGPKTGEQLAEMTKADHVLLVRILRHLAAMGVIIKFENDSYVKNEITERLATHAASAFFKFNFDAKSAACMALPEFLEKSKYRNTHEPNDCAFQCGHRSKDNCWEWSDHHRAAVDDFNQAVSPYMQQASWLNFYPFMKRVTAGHNMVEDEVMLVNISGGRGRECEAIRAKYPVLPGRMVLQDSADNIANALSVKGMDVMVHDIFFPQPIKGSRSLSSTLLVNARVDTSLLLGARMYYLRNVFSNHSDAGCLRILDMIWPVMEMDHSILVINEPILLDQGASLRATQIDLSLMACRSTIMRTRGQWARLLALGGFEIENIWSAFPESDSVIEAYLAEQ